MALSQVLQALLDMNLNKPGMDKPKPKPKAESFDMSGASSNGAFQKPELDNPGETSSLGAPLGFWEAYGNNVRPDIKQQAQAKLDTTRSESMRTQASQMMNDANALPHTQVTGKPNLESILLALAPAALGVNPSYLGKLGAGYMQGQQQELARQEQLRQQKVAMMMQQAQGMEKGADRALQGELATYSQDSQNQRNDADNARMVEMEKAREKHAADLKKYGQQEADFRYIQTIADKHFNESPFGQTEELQTELKDALKSHSLKYDIPIEDLQARFQGRNIGDKGIAATKLFDLQNDKAYKKGIDIWKSYLNMADRQQTITEDDITNLMNERQWLHDEHKVPFEAMPVPKAGQGWKQYVQGQGLEIRKKVVTQAEKNRVITQGQKDLDEATKVEKEQWKKDSEPYNIDEKESRDKFNKAETAWSNTKAAKAKETDKKKIAGLEAQEKERFQQAKDARRAWSIATDKRNKWLKEHPEPTKKVYQYTEPVEPMFPDMAGGDDATIPSPMPPWMKPSPIGGGSTPKGKPGKTLPPAKTAPNTTPSAPSKNNPIKMKNGKGLIG